MHRTIILLFIITLITACSKVDKEYYPNGNIKSEITFKHDKKNGKAIYYYNNGNINIQCHYKNDNLDGLYKKFNPNGTLIEATHYTDGLKNGSSVTYYDNGKIAIQMNFSNDIPDGEYKEYFENGQLKIKGQYENGFYHGHWEYYDFNGLQVGKADFEKGSGVQTSFYYGTQKVRITIEFEKNQKNGKETYFDKSGQIVKIIHYVNGKIDHIERIID